MTSVTKTGVVPGGQGGRLHGLDALRALAMVLGVWLHAALPYIYGLPPFFWAVDDPAKSRWIGHSVSLIHSWRMETFFLLSGFFTAMLVVRRGVRATLRQRALRIGAPFVLALLTIQPALAALWGLGYSSQWGFPAARTVEVMLKTSWGIDMPGSPGAPVRLWHLWFLYELLWFCAAGITLAAVCPAPLRRAGDFMGRTIARAMGAWWGVLVLWVPVAALLLLHGPTGARPNETLVPQWASLAYYALPFGAGWLIYPHRACIDRLGRFWWWPVGLALAAAFPVYLAALERGGALPNAPRGPMLAATIAHAGMTVAFSLGMIGLFTRLLASPGPRVQRWVRYGSDSAYWVYLAHLPVVVGLSILIVDWQANAWAKMGVVLAASTVVLLVSYQLLVRHTPIGRLLNGRRARRSPVGTNPDAPTPANLAPVPDSP